MSELVGCHNWARNMDSVDRESARRGLLQIMKIRKVTLGQPFHRNVGIPSRIPSGRETSSTHDYWEKFRESLNCDYCYFSCPLICKMEYENYKNINILKVTILIITLYSRLADKSPKI